MKKYYILFFAFLFTTMSFAQLKWSRVKVFGNESELRQLGDLGLPVDHGEYKKGTYFMTDLSEHDITKLDANGYNYEIVIDDVKAYYKSDRSDQHRSERSVCNAGGNTFDPVTPANFQLGTMAGFYTYQEFLDELDSMRSKYPNLITEKAAISSFTTVDGNPIYWLRLSDNPETDEAEPEVLYSAIHHAREPASLTQTIFYMWYLLENYGTNDEVTYLVDNTEMYFVPMINPDGYIYNVVNDPSGGGMHRKNRNLVSGGWGNQGVDLNRNYAYHWDESGTSNDPGNDTWPGTGPFSEVETQAMKWLVEQREFEFAFNSHTHGNLLLYPIGWASSEFAPHHTYFDRYTEYMVKYNGYNNIKSSGLYPASGDSDDWMYIDDIGVNHDTIFALTPEVSSEGTNNDFWPASTAIEDICKNTVHMNLVLSHMPHVFGVVTDLESSRIEDNTGYFNYEIERLGRTAGPITVNLTAVAGIQSLGAGNTHTLNLMEIEEDSIDYTLSTGLSFGDDIIYVIETDNGSWVRRDTVYKTFGVGTELFYDDCSTADNWTGDWSFTNEDFVSPNNCITDSPFTNHYDSNVSECQLDNSFSLSNATYAYINFYAKWEIEDNWDYTQFMISTNNGVSWTPLCGKYTNAGGSNQDEDEPLYDGFQTDWVLEEVDLTDYIGSSNVQFKFRIVSDQAVNEDGFYFDDFKLLTDGIEDTGFQDEELSFSVYPNPANEAVNIDLDESVNISAIEIQNELGQVVKTIQPTTNQVQMSTVDLSAGMYFVTLTTSEGQKKTVKCAISK